MGQSVILFKTLPSADYLDRMINDGVLRAAMTFQPGGCYAGAGIYPQTTAYVATTSDRSALSACPDPDDTLACYEYQVEQMIHKLSFGMPQAFNAFVWVTVRAGFLGEWGEHAGEVLRGLQEEAGADADGEYFAAGFLTGCGGHNAVFEFLTSDHQRLQRCIRLLTDKEYVEEAVVGHLAADDAKGFGDPERAPAS